MSGGNNGAVVDFHSPAAMLAFVGLLGAELFDGMEMLVLFIAILFIITVSDRVIRLFLLRCSWSGLGKLELFSIDALLPKTLFSGIEKPDSFIIFSLRHAES